MSDAGKAVFLSYASQDTEAAKRICDALRAAGIEVWFDQSELAGGDQWDAKIRGQIGSCALFMPVISASTQARREGYFRIEWRLAAQRTHAMADGTAFLVPVVIDATHDTEALVPAEFKGVQWTKLRGGETTPAFMTQVEKLLEEEVVAVVESGVPAEAPAQAGPAPARPGRGAYRLDRWQWWMIFPIFGMTMGLFLVMKERQHERPPVPEPAPSAPVKPAVPAVSEARQLAAKARAMSLDKYSSSADDYAAAEGLIKRALELDPNDGEIWAVSSEFNSLIRTRGFDHDPARREAARSQAERALSLAPQSIEGRYALARWQRDNDPDPAVAERSFKEVLARAPAHAGTLLSLGTLYQRTGRYEEAIALLERLKLIPEWKALGSYNEYLAHFSRSNFPEAERCVRDSIATEPSASSVTGLAMILLTVRGDTAGALAALATVPAASRNEHRVVWMTAFAQLAARQPDGALRTLDRLSADYIQDNWFTGPKAYWVGRAHAQAGRTEAARLAFESGLDLAAARLKAQPGSYPLHFMHAELLAWLGRPDEALAELRLLAELRQTTNDYWITNRARIFAVLGRPDEALPLLKELVLDRADKDWGWPLTPALLRIDPLWEKIHDDPRFRQLLTAAAAADIAALPPRVWLTNPELKRAIALLDGLQAIPEDVRLAEEIVQPVLEKFPTDPETVTAMARVESMWLLRGWDRSTARYLKAKSVCERAIQLAPDEPEALQAMAIYLYARGTENQRALDLAQRAVDLAPQEPRFYRQRDNCLFVLSLSPTDVDVLTDQTRQRNNAALERALDSARHTTELFPQDALVYYELARHYRDLGRWAEFEQETDAALALAPVANAMVWKARARLGLHNDVAGMKTLLDQVPDRVRSIERTVFSYFLYSVYTGEPRVGLEALNGMNETWMIDFDFRGPKALPVAVLLELQGKKELARLQYEAALKELERGRAANPADLQTYLVEAWILHGLGREEQARTALRVYNESITRPYTVSPMAGWWFHAVAANLLMGERETALGLMRDAVASQAEGRAALRGRFALDRRMAPFREDPEIKALLAEPEAKP